MVSTETLCQILDEKVQGAYLVGAHAAISRAAVMGTVFVVLLCAEKELLAKIGELLNSKEDTLLISFPLLINELQN